VARPPLSSSFYFGTPEISFSFICPAGSFINQISGQAASWIDGIAVACSDGSVSGLFGGSGGSAVTLAACNVGYNAFDLVWGTYMGRIQASCGGTPSGAVGSGLAYGAGYSTTYQCPGGTVLVGVAGSYRSYLDVLALVCSGECIFFFTCCSCCRATSLVYLSSFYHFRGL